MAEREQNEKRVKVIVYYPGTKAAMDELSERVASVHAWAVASRIRDLKCSHEQKIRLLDSVIGWQRDQLRKCRPKAYPQKGENIHAEKRYVC